MDLGTLTPSAPPSYSALSPSAPPSYGALSPSAPPSYSTLFGDQIQDIHTNATYVEENPSSDDHNQIQAMHTTVTYVTETRSLDDRNEIQEMINMCHRDVPVKSCYDRFYEAISYFRNFYFICALLQLLFVLFVVILFLIWLFSIFFNF